MEIIKYIYRVIYIFCEFNLNMLGLFVLIYFYICYKDNFFGLYCQYDLDIKFIIIVFFFYYSMGIGVKKRINIDLLIIGLD